MQGTLPLEAHVLLFREDMILGLHEDPTKTWENPTQEKSIYLCSYLYYLEPGIQLYDYFLKNWEVTSAFVVD